MLAFMPTLDDIWTNTTPDALMALCSEFRGFCRYATVMQALLVQARERSSSQSSDVPSSLVQFPETLKQQTMCALRAASHLELELQAVVDMAERNALLREQATREALRAQVDKARGLMALHAEWVTSLGVLAEELKISNVPTKSAELIGLVSLQTNSRLQALLNRLTQLVIATKQSTRQRH